MNGEETVFDCFNNNGLPVAVAPGECECAWVGLEVDHV
jgi:hypothetical protein